MSIEESVTRRFLATQDPSRILKDILQELRKLQAWSRSFESALRESQRSSQDAPRGHVWQDEWADFWQPFGPIQKKLYDLESSLEKIDENLGSAVDPYIEPPRAARIEEAIGDPKFAEKDGEDHIAYSEKALKEWEKAFSWWSDYAVKGVQRLLREI